MIKSKRIRWVRHVDRIEKSAYNLIAGKPDGNLPQGRPKRRWVNYIKVDLGEFVWVMWTGLVWLRMGRSGELL
jgi:hypothetical protein